VLLDILNIAGHILCSFDYWSEFFLLNKYFCLILHYSFLFHIPLSLHLQSRNKLLQLFGDNDRPRQCLNGHTAGRTCLYGKYSLGEIIHQWRHYVWSLYWLWYKSGTAQTAQCLVQKTGVTESTAQYSI